ncbi:Bro-N domain-containing protein [Pseudomonas petrae]|uniref:BRO-N domain-containing protein n=1 Tax=Pseudomonas petrae TaxID=2912190 RepID=UPI001F46EDFA|nr:BRO family protein [Pseudomonas petrae]MCF7558884.1 phage antirepressor [Pseudomonas petrae]
MNPLVKFDFNGAGVRAVTDEHGEAWFIARDVAELLDYVDTDQAIRTHCKGAQTYPVEITGQVRHVKVIPERDVYRLVMRSRLPAAEAFEEWVVGEVLPTIRKTGSYQRPMTQAEMIAASANILVSLERQQAQQQVDLVRVERKVEDMERFHVWDHRPSNCLSLTGVKAEMNKRYGLSGAVVDYVLKDWPHLPNPAGMVRNGHEEALGSQYMVWAKTLVTTAFKRFVSECQMETATQARHPYFEGRFRLVQEVQS